MPENETLIGFSLPGLAMAATELPDCPGCVRLENWEIGAGSAKANSYTIEELAEMHLAHIHAFPRRSECPVFTGFSMGGMILSVLATEFRSRLPRKCCFRFVSTSPNTAAAPAVAEDLLDLWKRVSPGDIDGFRTALQPFFSERFINEKPQRFEEYVSYRAEGKNRQTSKAFRRQTAAMRTFGGESYFARIDVNEAEFIFGSEDRVFGVSHRAELARILPEARVSVLPGVGHMLNVEHPSVFTPGARV